MPPNLRSVIERVTRGGRLVVSRRNFSSRPNFGNVIEVLEGSGGSVVYNVGRLLSFAAGCGCGYYYEGTLKKAADDRQKKIFQVLNAGQDDSKS